MAARIVLDIVPGALGAVVGGWLSALFGVPVSGLNLHSLPVAVVGAVVVVLGLHD